MVLDRHQRAFNAFRIVSVLIATITAASVNTWVPMIQERPAAKFFATVILVPLISELLPKALNDAYNRSSIMRRLFMGREHLEGTYLQIITHKGNIRAFGIVTVNSFDGALRLDGFNYSPDGTLNHHWRSQPGLLICREPLTIRYAYQIEGTSDQREGLATWQFRYDPGSTRPTQFAGYYGITVDDRRAKPRGSEGNDAPRSDIHNGPNRSRVEHRSLEGYLLSDDELLMSRDPSKRVVLFQEWLKLNAKAEKRPMGTT